MRPLFWKSLGHINDEKAFKHSKLVEEDFFIKRNKKTYHIFNQKQASEFSKSKVDLLSHLLGVNLQVVGGDLNRHSGQLKIKIIIMTNLMKKISA